MLPVAEGPWFERREVEPGLFLLLEPHVDPLERANLFFVKGRDLDLLIDGGMGITPLRPALADLIDKPVLAVATHTHLDHVGAMHEFDDRAVHPLEAAALAEPRRASLFSADFPFELRAAFVRAGYPPLGELLIDALPHAGYDPRAYALLPAPATRLVGEGDVIETGGGRVWRVLHLPGHSPGQIGLLDERDGTLLAGDAVYDGPLLYEGGAGMSVRDYAPTLRRLRDLRLRVVHGGHDPSFGQARLREICDAYLGRWEGEGLIP